MFAYIETMKKKNLIYNNIIKINMQEDVKSLEIGNYTTFLSLIFLNQMACLFSPFSLSLICVVAI